MAMNYLDEKKKEQELQQQQQQPQQQTGLQGVSANTQQQLNNYQQGYQPNAAVQQAQQNVEALQAMKPQTYNSRYSAQLDGLLAQIQGRGDFKYSFDGDELFKNYADMFTQKGKQASMDVMGQAAGLTGGYGNSYAQGAGQQAYQQYLMELYSMGPEFRDRAYQVWKDKQGDLKDQAGLLMDLDAVDYGRHRDSVADWNTEMDRAMDAARDERNFDYNNYTTMLDYWMNQAGRENADFRADQDEAFRQAQLAEQIRTADMDEAYRRDAFAWQQFTDNMDEAYRRDALAQDQRQFEMTDKYNWAQLEEKASEFLASMTEEQRQFNVQRAIAYVTDILANGQIPSNELLVMAGLSYEDALKLVAQIKPSYGPGKTQDDEGGVDIPETTWYDAEVERFRSLPGNLNMQDLNASATNTKTVAEMAAMVKNAEDERIAAEAKEARSPANANWQDLVAYGTNKSADLKAGMTQEELLKYLQQKNLAAAKNK